MSALDRWTVEIPGIEPVTIFADTAGAACLEAALLHHLPAVPPDTTARNQRGQEFVCSSAR